MIGFKNNNYLWSDWLSKHENNQENARINENSTLADTIFETYHDLMSDTVGTREIRPNHRSVTGLVKPNKEQPQIPFESSLERDFILLMAGRYDVLSIEAQPVTIRYADEFQREREYTPDFLVLVHKGPNRQQQYQKLVYLVEVKYSDELQQDPATHLRKFRHASEWCAYRGWKFSVFTENEIRTPELERARYLLPYRFAEQEIYLAHQIMKTVSKRQPCSIGEMLDQKFPGYSSDQILAEILRLLSINAGLRSDPLTPINSDTKVWLNDYNGS